MPEIDETEEVQTARKVASGIEFMQGKLDENPDVARSYDPSDLDIAEAVLEGLRANGNVVSELWNGQWYVAKTQAILDDDGKRSGRIPAE